MRVWSAVADFAGEEQAKVEALSSRLRELGEDVDNILAEMADAEQDDESAAARETDLL